MAYSQAWLESTARRCILVEATVNKVGTGTTTLYFSTTGFITTSGDVFYQPVVVGGLKFNESLSMSGAISTTYGDVQLNNKNGEFDSYLDASQYIWANGLITIYYGDPTWVCQTATNVRADFKKIFNGVIVDIDSKDRTTLSIKVADKLQKLNSSLTESIIGTYGTWAGGSTAQTNANALKPLVFGEVFNISPILIDPLNNEYYLNNGPTQELIDIRDNGVPISSYTFYPSTGKVRLTSTPVGAVTASLKGISTSVAFTDTNATQQVSTYRNNVASIIALIVSQYGISGNQISLTTDDIDFKNFNSFSTQYQQLIGIFIADRQNTLQVCNDILNTFSAQLFCTKDGLLQIIVVGTPIDTAIVPAVTITTSDIINPTLAISSRSSVVAATKLGYCKNWTVQPGLITAIPQGHKDSYATEYLTYTSTNATAQTNYKLTVVPAEKDTYFIVDTEAKAEADRLNNFYSRVHTVFSFTGTSKLLFLQLGQRVTLIHPRFQLYNNGYGVDCQVISLSPDWTRGTIDIEVMTL